MEPATQYGFWLAGESLIRKRQRDIAVSPRKQAAEKTLAPVDDGLGDLDSEKKSDYEEVADVDTEWTKLADKYEELEDRVNEYLNENQSLGVRKPPIVIAPPKVTQEDWEKHQATHTHPTCRVASTVQQPEQLGRDIPRRENIWWQCQMWTESMKGLSRSQWITCT